MRLIFLTLLLANIGYFIYREYLYPQLHDEMPIPESGVTNQQPVESIYLLSENDNLRRRAIGRVVSNPLTATDGNDGDRGKDNCTAVGPFSDLFVGQDAVERLKALNFDVELKAIDTDTGKSDYRVMLPKASSLQDAFRKIRELDSQGIGSYVITKGDSALSISLGVFSTQVAARTAQTDLRSLGYEVEIAAIARKSREFWMYSRDGQDLDLKDEVWRTIMETYQNLGERSQPCAGDSFQPRR